MHIYFRENIKDWHTKRTGSAGGGWGVFDATQWEGREFPIVHGPCADGVRLNEQEYGEDLLHHLEYMETHGLYFSRQSFHFNTASF